MRAHLEDPAPDLGLAAPKTPAPIVRLVRDLLQKDPDDRPANATAVRERVARAFDLGEAALIGDPLGGLTAPEIVGRTETIAAVNTALKQWVISDGPAVGPAVVLLCGLVWLRSGELVPCLAMFD